MNFFAHAWLADGRRADAAFVLGSMLPDLAPMAGLRVAAIDHRDLAAGAAFHLACDSAFHSAPAFMALVAESSRCLRRRGVGRGPARGAAHVGLELLLDGWIAARFDIPCSYRDALDGAEALSPGVRFARGRRGAGIGFAELCARIAESELPHAYGDPAFTATRIARILARRPRLAPDQGERATIARWAAEVAPRVDEAAGVWLGEVVARVGDPARSGARPG